MTRRPNLNRLSGSRLILGVGVRWARQEFEALGVPFGRRGALTDEYLRTIRDAWRNTDDYDTAAIPIWLAAIATPACGARCCSVTAGTRYGSRPDGWPRRPAG
ncbi:LLM class flavin-dependent oxidoreductase [Micromonospora sp. NPDC047707]|uniref:LLM class flavin-dependent oxidoreductase n=1 Tax=Micromonospora sp. NPDC047707 TaxID=3154498 RepID=UPI0034543E42